MPKEPTESIGQRVKSFVDMLATHEPTRPSLTKRMGKYAIASDVPLKSVVLKGVEVAEVYLGDDPEAGPVSSIHLRGKRIDELISYSALGVEVSPGDNLGSLLPGATEGHPEQAITALTRAFKMNQLRDLLA